MKKIFSNDYLNVLFQSKFRNMFVAGMTSSFGDGLHSIAVIWLISDESISAISVTSVVVANSLPVLLFGLLGGSFADRYDRIKQMILIDVLRAIVVLLIPVLGFFHLISVPALLFITFLRASLDQFFYPAHNAVVPHTISKDDLPVANSLNSSGKMATRAFAVAIAGSLIDSTGILWVFYLDAISFIVSALFLKQIDISGAVMTTEKKYLGLKSVVKDVKMGVSYVLNNDRLKHIAVVNVVGIFAFAPYQPIALIFFKDTVGMSATQYGLNSSIGLFGLMIGFIVAGGIVKKLSPKTSYTLGYTLMGVSTILIGLIPIIGFIFVGSVFRSISNTILIIAYSTLIQTESDDKQRGRVYSTMQVISEGLRPIAALLAGYFADISNPSLIIIISGIIFLLASFRSRWLHLAPKNIVSEKVF